MDISPILQELNAALPVDRKEELKKQLAHHLNALLLHNFPALVQLLYRVDVSEKKLKTVLKENPQEDAGNLLADMIIQRQQEKFLSRQSFPSSPSIPDEEKW